MKTASAAPSASARQDPAAQVREALSSVHLDFYGVRAAVRSPQADVVEEFRRDFSWFIAGPVRQTGATASADGAGIELTFHLQPPPAGVSAGLALGRDAVRDDGDVRLVQHADGSLVRFDFSRERGEIWCADMHRMHELGYILLLSRVGAALDERGLHRLHGLGLAHQGRGLVALLPIRGGKTTLALRVLKQGVSRLLSEDTPLVDRRGNLWPFPVRFGVCGDAPLPGIPARMQRVFHRRRWGSKVLIDLEHAAGRLAPHGPVAPRALLFGGVFEPRDRVDVSRRSRWRALPALVLNLLVGVGIPQGREYVLRPRLKALAYLARAAASRAVALAALLFRSRVYRLRLSTDSSANVKAVEALLD